MTRKRTRREFLRDTAIVGGGVVGASLAGQASKVSASTVVPVTLTVDASARGVTIPDDFAGLGFERRALFPDFMGVDGYLLDPADTSLVRLFRHIGIRSIRIGGGSVDGFDVAGFGPDGYTGVDKAFEFARAAGVSVIYSLRLLNPASSPIPDLVSEDAAVAAHIWPRYRDSLSSFAIGNEPDNHAYHTVDPAIFETVPGVLGSAYPSYLADWQRFAGAILDLVPPARFAGPDTAAGGPASYTPNPQTGVSWTEQFARDERDTGILAAATQHHYVGGSPGATTAAQAIDNMFSREWVEQTAIGTQPDGTGGTTKYWPYPYLYAQNLEPVLELGVPYRMTEANDYLAGVAGASDGFAAALWGLDYLHWWAAHGAAGINFHNKQWIPTDTVIPNPDPTGLCAYLAGPKAYAIKAFDLGSHGQVKHVTPDPVPGINITAYAVGDGSTLDVTVINKTTGSQATDAAVTLIPEHFVPAVADVVVLSSGTPGDATPLTATLGGGTINCAAPWSGRATALRPDALGHVSLTVRATTAAVVTMQARP